MASGKEANHGCLSDYQNLLERYDLIIVSNRGPFSLQTDEAGNVIPHRSGGGGLVTALLGLANNVPSTWISCAMSDEDRAWTEKEIPLNEAGQQIRIRFAAPETQAYDDYYSVISNPLLWFLHHSIWDFANSPTLHRETWQSWENGYVAVNRLIADSVIDIDAGE
jgi:trehalose 6-phosphate synthase